MPTEKQYKRACISFDRACNDAIRCRHDRYQVSCNSCDDKDECEIQERVNKNLEIKRKYREENGC